MNDDLKDVHLDDLLIADPPLVIWPEWEAKPVVPEDTLEILRRGLEDKGRGA